MFHPIPVIVPSMWQVFSGTNCVRSVGLSKHISMEQRIFRVYYGCTRKLVDVLFFTFNAYAFPGHVSVKEFYVFLSRVIQTCLENPEKTARDGNGPPRLEAGCQLYH